MKQIPSFMLDQAHNTFNYILATNYYLSLSLSDNWLCELARLFSFFCEDSYN